MHGGMLERDRGVGWRTGSTRVPLLEETTDRGQGSLRREAIPGAIQARRPREHLVAARRCSPPCTATSDQDAESLEVTRS